MSEMLLTELWRYPVKSMRGARHAHLAVDARGPRDDRRWMLVDAGGRFLTQRQLPRMALLNAAVGDDGLVLSLDDTERFTVGDTVGEELDVRVWGDTCRARAVDPEADRWLSDFLGQACRLVELPPGRVRPVDPHYATADDQVGFADGFPFLLISQGSLDGLNARLGQQLPMARFRPNLVVSGCGPHAEDSWKRIRIGELTFRVVKPCSRCIIPTIDPQTAERDREPLRTLMEYRQWDNKIWFGQNLLHDGVGELAEGMPVEVLD